MIYSLWADVVLAPRARVGWGLEQVLIGIIVLAAVAAIVYFTLKQMGIAIPPYIAHIIWIVVVAMLAILAIRFLLTL